MSPEVACNRFYFVIVLVPLPFVFFMCSLPSALPPALLPAPPPSSDIRRPPSTVRRPFVSVLVLSRSGFFHSSLFGYPSSIVHRPCFYVSCAAHFWGQIGGLINQICHSNLGVRNFIFYFYNIFPSTVHRPSIPGQPTKCVKTRKKYLEPFSMDSRRLGFARLQRRRRRRVNGPAKRVACGVKYFARVQRIASQENAKFNEKSFINMAMNLIKGNNNQQQLRT